VPTSNECRQYAQDCLLLATTANDFYAQDALIRLAADFETMADRLQRRPANRTQASMHTPRSGRGQEAHAASAYGNGKGGDHRA
jgi:hypothetical protein